MDHYAKRYKDRYEAEIEFRPSGKRIPIEGDIFRPLLDQIIADIPDLEVGLNREGSKNWDEFIIVVRKTRG